MADVAGSLEDWLVSIKLGNYAAAIAAEGYEDEESKSQRDDKFLGMPFDEDNQADLSEERAKTWIAQLKAEGMPL